MTGEERDRLAHQEALTRFGGNMPEGRTPKQRADSLQYRVPAVRISPGVSKWGKPLITWATKETQSDPIATDLRRTGNINEIYQVKKYLMRNQNAHTINRRTNPLAALKTQQAARGNTPSLSLSKLIAALKRPK